MRRSLRRFIMAALAISTAAALAGCQPSADDSAGIAPQTMADALHAVLESDRTVYTREVVNRLTVQQQVIEASEHWKEEPALPLPAQMFRMGAERVMEQDTGFSYALLSAWAINPQNAPRTEAEIAGLRFVAENEGQNFYAEETLGGQRYFTAVYADEAVAQACVACHNEHQDSPRRDFALGDVMGGVVVRIALDE